MTHRLADLHRQGFMKSAFAPPKKAKKPEPPTVACEKCQDWHPQGKHRYTLEILDENGVWIRAVTDGGKEARFVSLADAKTEGRWSFGDTGISWRAVPAFKPSTRRDPAFGGTGPASQGKRAFEIAIGQLDERGHIPVQAYLRAFYGHETPQEAHRRWIAMTPAQRAVANKIIDTDYFGSGGGILPSKRR